MINVVKDLSESWYRLLNKFYLPQIKPNDGLPVGVFFYLDFDFNRNKYIQVIK